MPKSLKDEAMSIINDRTNRMIREAEKIAASVREPFLEAVKKGSDYVLVPISLTEVTQEEVSAKAGTFDGFLRKYGLEGLDIQIMDNYSSIKVSMPIKDEK